MAGKEKTIIEFEGQLKLDAKDAENKLSAISKKELTVPVKLDTSNLKEQLDKISSKSVKLGVKLDTKTYTDAINNLPQKNITLGVKLDHKAFNEAINNLPKKITTLGLKVDKASYNEAIASLAKKTVTLGLKVDKNSFTEAINNLPKKSVVLGLKIDKAGLKEQLANVKNNISVGVKVSVSSFREAIKNLPQVRALVGVRLDTAQFRSEVNRLSQIRTSTRNMPILAVQADQSQLFQVERRLAIITNQIRRINRMTLRVNTVQNNTSRGGRFSNANSSNPSASGNMAGKLGGNVIDDLTYMIHFLGRSSKGMGSFGEALGDLVSRMNTVSGGFGTLGTAITGTFAIFGGFAFATNIAITAINGLASALQSIAQLIITALKPGFELMAQRDTTMLTTKAALKTSATVDGRAVTNEEATAESAFLFSRAMQEAAKTVLNLNDILTAQQGVLPMLLNKGMTPKQAQDVIFGVAGVAKTGRLAPNQVLQETRDLAQGSITARTSQVANILGITNQDLAKFKGNVDELYSYLMQKFQEYTKVMEEYANTPVGAIEQLQETWGIAAMTIVDEYGPLIVEVAHEITKSLGEFDEQGNFHLSDWLKELADGLQEIVVYAASCADAILNMIQSIVGGEDPIETMINFIHDMIGALTILVGTVLGVAKILKGFWVGIKVGVSILEALSKAALGVAQACFAMFAAMAGNPASALDWAKTANSTLREAGQAVLNAIDLEGQWNGTISSGWTSGKGNKEFDTFLNRQGIITNKVISLIEKARNTPASKGKDIQGMRGTAKDSVDEKARKKAIKDAQKVMKEHIQGLKEQLKDHIAELKETLAKNKIAFDEGFMTIKDYYTQKAQIEAEEARLRLEEAQAEKALILATPYENQADQLKALHSIEREIRQQTRAYNKGVQAQKEVAKAAERSSKAMELITGLFSGHDAVQTTPIVNQQQQQTVMDASTNQKAIESFASDVAVKNMGYVANEITNQAIAKLGNNERGWTLAKFANAIAAAESHYNQGAVSGAGAIGIMQLMPDTASSLGVNPYDWKQNIAGGIQYLLDQLETFGWDLKKAAAAYNAGPGAVKDYGGVPPYRETQGYVSRVTDYMGRIDSNGFNASTGGNAQVIQSASQTMLDQIGTLLVYNINEYVRKGIPYAYGGTSEAGFDCSGMVKYLFDQLGISIQRTADYQYDQMKAKGSIFDNKNWLLPGDLVFMRGSDPGDNGVGHVGIYAGNNQMVHMPGSGRQAEYANLDNRRDIVGYGSVRNYTYGTQIGQMMGQAQKSVAQVSSMVSNEVYGKLVDELLIGKSMEVIDALKKAAANVTETGSEADKALLNQVSDLVNLRAELDGRITGNQRSGVMKILMEYYKNLINAKQDENLIQAYTDKMMTDIRDQRKKVITDMFNFTLSDIEYKGNIVGNEILTGILNSEEKIADYFKKVFDVDPGNLFNPGNYYKQLEALYREYEEKGELMSAVEIRNLLDEALKKVQNVIKGWIDKGLEYIDKQQAIFEADASFTNLQREFGNREFQAYKAEYEYGMRAKLADRLQDRFNNRSDEMKTLQSRLEAIKNITTDLYEKEIAMNSLEQDTTKVVAEKSRYLKEQSDIESRLQLIRGQRSDIEREKMLNDLELQRLKLLKEQPKYLTDLRNTAKQALEDGLVTFLTDGINEAENLGEALRNLAISFLKEIQQMSAKWMVKSLMNKWFGQFVFRSPEEISADNSSAALSELRTQTKLQSDIVRLLSGRAPLSNTVSANSAGAIASTVVTAGATTSLLVPTNSMLNMSYDQYMNKQKNPYSFSKEDLGLKDFTKGFKSGINDIANASKISSQAAMKQASTSSAIVSSNQTVSASNTANTAATQTQTAVTNTATATEVSTSAQEVAVDTQSNTLKSETNSKLAETNVKLQQVNAKTNVGGSGMYVAGGANVGALGVAGAGSSAVSGFKGLGGGGFFNGGMFQNLLGTITDITGSALGQLAGDFLAIKAIFKGDTKEKLLGTIFLELQLLYMGQQQLIIWAQMASNWLQEIAFELQNISMGVRFATGGYVSGQGTGTSDSIPTMLSNGEYVIKASSVRKYGTNFLNAVNSGNFTKIKSGVHHYADGGLVSDLAQEQTARGISNFGKDISNNISNTANISVALVRDEQEGMKQLLRSPEGQRIMLDFSRRYASVTSRF